MPHYNSSLRLNIHRIFVTVTVSVIVPFWNKYLSFVLNIRLFLKKGISAVPLGSKSKEVPRALNRIITGITVGPGIFVLLASFAKGMFLYG